MNTAHLQLHPNRQFAHTSASEGFLTLFHDFSSACAAYYPPIPPKFTLQYTITYQASSQPLNIDMPSAYGYITKLFGTVSYQTYYVDWRAPVFLFCWNSSYGWYLGTCCSTFNPQITFCFLSVYHHLSPLYPLHYNTPFQTDLVITKIKLQISLMQTTNVLISLHYS